VEPRSRLAGILILATIIAPAYSMAAEKKGAKTAPAAGEACSLLTKEDAAAALGEAVTPKLNGSSQGGPGMSVSSCEYGGSGLHRIRLIVTHFPATQADIIKGSCETKGHEGLTGLGDVACWYNDKHEEIQVLKGTTMLSVAIRGKPDPSEAVKGAMKKVYGRFK